MMCHPCGSVYCHISSHLILPFWHMGPTILYQFKIAFSISLCTTHLHHHYHHHHENHYRRKPPPPPNTAILINNITTLKLVEFSAKSRKKWRRSELPKSLTTERELQLTGNQGTTHQRRVHPHQEIKLMTQRKEVKGWKNIHCQRRISIAKEAAVDICRKATWRWQNFSWLQYLERINSSSCAQA